MFDVARDAGLLPSEIAKCLGVHRVTVSAWLNGHNPPHRYLAERVEKLLDAVDAAVEAGELPIPRDVRPRERSRYIERIWSKYLNAAAETGDNDVEA